MNSWISPGILSTTCSISGGCSGDGLFVEEYTGIHSWVEDLARYTVVHSRTVAVLFVDTRPVDAIAFHHGLLGADDPKRFFNVPV